MRKSNKAIQSKSVFRYYNCNPHHRRTDDCVVRAICTMLDDRWEVTMSELANEAIENGFMLNSPECYGKYLENYGYVKQKQPSHEDGSKVRFAEFCQKFDGHAVCHCGKSHVTYVADNCVWDIWDTQNEIVGSYWIPESEQHLVDRIKF